MFNIKQSLTDLWLKVKDHWFKAKEDLTVPLDQVSRFYQSEFYQSLDDDLKSAFYDGPLGGLDSRIIECKDIDFLMDCYCLWESGRNVSCGIYGEKGTGLSTLLNIFTTQLKQKNQSYKQLDIQHRLCDQQDIITELSKLFAIEPKSYALDDFIEVVKELPKSVIIIDNIHFLVQRTLTAQIIVDALSAIILASRGHHLWVIAGEEQSWRRLSYGYNFDNLFSHQQHIANFNESQMRELLVKRFSYAGFHTINDIAIDKLKDEKSPLNEIAKRSKGCVELSLFYALNKIAYGIEQKSLLISPPQEIDMTSIKKLSRIELFTLAEISAHGQLSIKEHHLLFRISLSDSKMVLEHLRVIGILDKNEAITYVDTYGLKLIISAVVIRYLISMNYLY
ncbi:AAA family ATPase [Pseudomonas sp. HK3]